jgi:hypothetical protein
MTCSLAELVRIPIITSASTHVARSEEVDPPKAGPLAGDPGVRRRRPWSVLMGEPCIRRAAGGFAVLCCSTFLLCSALFFIKEVELTRKASVSGM